MGVDQLAKTLVSSNYSWIPRFSKLPTLALLGDKGVQLKQCLFDSFNSDIVKLLFHNNKFMELSFLKFVTEWLSCRQRTMSVNERQNSIRFLVI